MQPIFKKKNTLGPENAVLQCTYHDGPLADAD